MVKKQDTLETPEPQDINSTSQKVIEIYLETLKEYKKKLNKEKLIVFMQVGEFFEIYGIIYPDGTKVGDIWEFCDNVNLNIGPKKQEVYKNPEIKAFMAGSLIQHSHPYIQKGVDKFGWTIVIFEQNKIGNTNKYERVHTQTISPGININSDTYSNISMVIYIEQIKLYFEGFSSEGFSSEGFSPSSSLVRDGYRRDSYLVSKSLRAGVRKSCLNIGVSFVDCITGNNGVLAINNSSIADISIPFDELLKLLTIKNPKELTIYVQNIENEKLSNDDIVNALHLFNYQFKIIREEINDKYMNLNYQNNLLNTVYNKYRGLIDISQQLDIEGSAHYYTRIALCLLLDFILIHDKSIIQKLDKPEIILNSDKYLMLANNSLEQLDIIDNLKADSQSAQNSKRISLLELLDNTKTPLGKNLFRNRISTPITDHEELQKRYKTIKEFETIHNNYMKKNMVSIMNDKFGSPLHQLRQHLSGIKNIDNYLRKIITGNISPGDISIYINSLNKCINLYEYINGVISNEKLSCTTNTNTNTNTKTNTNTNQLQITELPLLIPNTDIFQSLTEIHNLLSESIILENLSCNIWGDIENNPFKKGISKVLDDLQMEIDSDRTLLDNLVIELSSIVEPKFNKELYNTDNYKAVICIADNASKGIHIHTTKIKKDILEEYFIKKQKIIKIGKYTITHKDIKFTQIKDNKWEIDIIYLKSSNGTLKVNIDKMGKTVKGEMVKWLQEWIVNTQVPAKTADSITTLTTLITFAKFIAEIDVVQSNVLNVVEKGYVEPTIDMSHSHSFIKAEKMRHPIIEHISKYTKYIPNDIMLGIDGIDGMLLFGVNAVGKSSLMKSIGINIIMAQAGMYVASSSFVYKPYKYLFTRIRNNDNIYAGLSSFEVEMKEFKVILKYANEDSIILGDELCSGTETQDATALVASGVSNLSKRKSSFMFATHLHFLADMSYIKELNNVKLFHLLVERDVKDPSKLIYTRTLQPGNGPKSYGILVCETMDLDRDFINKAKEIRESMNNLQNTNHNHNNNHNNISIGSKYNINKIISICEICKNANACDVHHINQQCDANENNIINDNEHGIFNKNKLWNLVSLCKECHQSIHSAPPRIIIEGYVNTSSGIELIYTKQDLENPARKLSLETKQDLQDFKNPARKLSLETKQDLENPARKLSLETRELEGLNPSHMNKLIISLKQRGLSPKKIQYDLKKQYNYEITQQNIRQLNYIENS